MLTALRFFRDGASRVLLVGDRWPEDVEVSAAVLEESAPYMVFDDDTGYIEMSVFNGCAFYRVTGMHGTVGIEKVYHAHLVTGSIGFDP